MTDYAEDVMGLLRKNVEANQKPEKAEDELKEFLASTSISTSDKPLTLCQKLDWTSFESDLEAFESQSFDIVIGSDLIYQGSPYDQLALMLGHLNTISPIVCFICMPTN